MKKVFMDHWLLIAFIFSVLLGGFNAIGVRFTVLELPPYWGAALRFAPASMLLFLLAFYLKLPMPRGRALLGAIMFGALNFGGSYAFIYYGMEKVQPGMSMVILALVPLFTMTFAITHRQETFRWRAFIGTLLAIGGIALVFQEQVSTNVPFISLLSMILGAACIAEAGVIAKGFPKSHPITTSAIGMASGATILFLMSLIWHENLALPARTNTWIALIFLILVGSCAIFILFLYMLKRLPASTMSYQFVLFPFVTLTASAWITHETLNPILLAGGALVIIGVYFGVLFSPMKKKVEQPVVVPCE